MRRFFTICLLAGFAISANAADLHVVNAGFDLNTHNETPTGWVVEPPDGAVYVWDDAASTDKRLAIKDASTVSSSVEQSLTDTHPSLSVEDCGNWTVGFDYGWRTDTAGGDCEFTVSMVDTDTDTILASTTLVVPASGSIFNVETPMGTAALSLSYDPSSVTAGHAVAVRIKRDDPADASPTYSSTIYIDNITVDAVDLATAPPIAPPYLDDPIEVSEGVMGKPYDDTLEGKAHDPGGDDITFTKESGPDWLSLATTGELSGTPDVLDTNTFLVVATAGGESTTGTLYIAVRNTESPEWSEDPINLLAEVNQPFSGSLDGLATDPDGNNVDYSKVSGPDWLTVLASGELLGTAPSTAGTITFVVAADDGEDPASEAALLIYVQPVQDVITLLNADFEGGHDAAKTPDDWTETAANHGGSWYAEDWGAGAGYDKTLNFQARGDGNIMEQSFDVGEVTANTYGSFDVTMDLGTRVNAGHARSLVVEIWNASDSVSLASATNDFPTSGTGFIGRETFTLTYDNNAPGLVGDEIVLRLISNGEGDTWATTHWIDNIAVQGGGGSEETLPATILSITSQPGNIMRIVVDAPSAGELYQPKAKSNLIIGDWGDVAHSVDGSAPWNVTNLSYVTEFESGTNEVIYVQADETQKFFEIIGN